MADAGIARHSFGIVDIAFGCSPAEGSFDTTMLVTKLDLQMQNGFAHALKPKMTGFDDAGMNWSDCDFMDFITLDLEVVGDSGTDNCVRIYTAIVWAVEADGLEPGMTLGSDSPFFVEFALEPVQLRDVRSQSRILTSGSGGEYLQASQRVMSQDGIDDQIITHGNAKEGSDPGASGDQRDQFMAEIRHGKPGDI